VIEVCDLLFCEVDEGWFFVLVVDVVFVVVGFMFFWCSSLGLLIDCELVVFILVVDGLIN